MNNVERLLISSGAQIWKMADICLSLGHRSPMQTLPYLENNISPVTDLLIWSNLGHFGSQYPFLKNWETARNRLSKTCYELKKIGVIRCIDGLMLPTTISGDEKNV